MLASIGGYASGGSYDGDDASSIGFTNRVGTYLALMSGCYPSTDERQWVHLDYPDAKRDLNRWLPLVKWLLAIPHHIVLAFLYLAMLVVVIVLVRDPLPRHQPRSVRLSHNSERVREAALPRRRGAAQRTPKQ